MSGVKRKDLRFLRWGFKAILWGALFSLGLSASPAFGTGLNGDTAYTDGPNVCGGCHPDKFDDWLSHGHSRKLAHSPALTVPGDGTFGLTADARSMVVPMPY